MIKGHTRIQDSAFQSDIGSNRFKTQKRPSETNEDGLFLFRTEMMKTNIINLLTRLSTNDSSYIKRQRKHKFTSFAWFTFYQDISPVHFDKFLAK